MPLRAGVGSGSRPVLFGTEEYGGGFGRVLGRKPITRFGKVKQPFCMVDLVSDEKRAHQTPGLFGIETDDFKMTVFFVFENGCKDFGFSFVS